MIVNSHTQVNFEQCLSIFSHGAINLMRIIKLTQNCHFNNESVFTHLIRGDRAPKIRRYITLWRRKSVYIVNT